HSPSSGPVALLRRLAKTSYQDLRDRESPGVFPASGSGRYAISRIESREWRDQTQLLVAFERPDHRAAEQRFAVRAALRKYAGRQLKEASPTRSEFSPARIIHVKPVPKHRPRGRTSDRATAADVFQARST